MALEWTDVDFATPQLTVARSGLKGHVMTFCSHLAMHGAPAQAIQELAGHRGLGATQRYMHLSPAALDAAIRLLETGTEFRGELLEAAGNGALARKIHHAA